MTSSFAPSYLKRTQPEKELSAASEQQKQRSREVLTGKVSDLKKTPEEISDTGPGLFTHNGKAYNDAEEFLHDFRQGVDPTERPRLQSTESFLDEFTRIDQTLSSLAKFQKRESLRVSALPVGINPSKPKTSLVSESMYTFDTNPFERNDRPTVNKDEKAAKTTDDIDGNFSNKKSVPKTTDNLKYHILKHENAFHAFERKRSSKSNDLRIFGRRESAKSSRLSTRFQRRGSAQNRRDSASSGSDLEQHRRDSTKHVQFNSGRRDSSIPTGVNLEPRPSFADTMGASLRRRSSRLALLRRQSSFFQTPVVDEVDTEDREPPIELFRRKAKLVKMVVSVCLVLKNYAIDAGLMQNYIVDLKRRTHKDGESEELDFNLKDYKMNKELGIPDHIKALLDKPPDKRSEEDVKSIVRIMRKNLPSFKKYTSDIQLMMCRIVSYMQCGRNRVVVRKGHIGYSVYFVYTGSVSVVLDKDVESIFAKPEVMLLKRGACFGEIALLENTCRSATVVCAEDCEFLCIDKEDFIDNGLFQKMEQEYHERLSFFQNWGPLKELDDHKVKSLSYCSRTEDFNHNKVLVEDSRKNELLWFVLKGCCDVLRLVDLEKSPDYEAIRNLRYGGKQYISETAPDTPRRMRAKSAPVRRSQPMRSHTFQNGNAAEDSDENEIKENRSTHRVSLGPVHRKISQHNNEENNKVVEDPVNAGIYVKVETLRNGKCFDIESLFAPSTERYSLVSQGCVVIHVPKSKFQSLCGHNTLDQIEETMCDKYPSDDQLTSAFLKKSVWDDFKHEIVEDVVTKHQHANANFANSLRNCKLKDHGATAEANSLTSHLYTPITARSHTPLVGSYSLTPNDMETLSSQKIRKRIENRRPQTACVSRHTRDREIKIIKEPRKIPSYDLVFPKDVRPQSSPITGAEARLSISSSKRERLQKVLGRPLSEISNSSAPNAASTRSRSKCDVNKSLETVRKIRETYSQRNINDRTRLKSDEE